MDAGDKAQIAHDIANLILIEMQEKEVDPNIALAALGSAFTRLFGAMYDKDQWDTITAQLRNML